MKRWNWKLFAGIGLLLLAVGGLIFWEMEGREMLLMDEVLVASSDIEAGVSLKSDMVRTILLPRESIAEGALTAKTLAEVAGMKTSQSIQEKQQITVKTFEDHEGKLGKGESYYVLDPDWIAMRSSSLRKGDIVTIISEDRSRNFGDFTLAFVKDEQEHEVWDLNSFGEMMRHRIKSAERTEASSVISHVEIIADEESYFNIREYCRSIEIPSLVLVMKEGKR